MLRSAASRISSAAALLVGIMTLLACTLRLRCWWVRLVRSVAEIGLRLRPSLYDGQDAYKQEHASGPVRNRRQKEKLCQVLQEADGNGVAPAEVARRLGFSQNQSSPLFDFEAADAFAGIADDIREVAVQYSGGADSTVATIIAAQRFEKVHLLTFYHPFIREKHKSAVNAAKLAQILGNEAVIHRYVDATQTLSQIMFGDYWGDYRKHGTAPVGWPCLACKLSFDTESIQYARDNGIELVIDGADLRVEFQLSQGHKGMLELRRQFYLEYDIEFRHPVVHIEDTTKELLLFGAHSDPACILYPHQGRCIGNDLLGAIYKRFYFLPKYGVDLLSDAASRWAKEKIQVCKQLLGSPASEQGGTIPAPQPPGALSEPVL